MSESEKTQMIQDAQNAEELFAAFEKIGSVVGSRKSYTREVLEQKYITLRQLCKTIDFGNVPFNNLTRTHGIRAKAMELLFYEKHEI
jgi:hypothetical protein